MTVRVRKILFGSGLALTLSATTAIVWSAAPARSKSPPDHRSTGTAQLAAAPNSMTKQVPPHRPPGYRPSVSSGLTDYQGHAVTVSCMTCHATRPPNRTTGTTGPGAPAEFHQGLAYAHANQSCLSCHNPDDYETLRLADGRRLEFAHAQQLCAQCHGPQTRDYLHGSHGGMNGRWQNTAGARTRNTCTDCHDPHAPAYPHWAPIFKPRDSAARQQAEREAAHRATLSPAPHHE